MEVRVLIVSPYPLLKNRPEGVSNFILESKPYLEKRGFIVKTLGPNTQDSDNAADFILGRAITITNNQTQLQSAFTLNQKKAREIIKSFKPNIIVIHEPYAAPFLTSTVISAIPRQKNGNLSACVICYFHAQTENLGFLISSTIFLTKSIPRIIFNPELAVQTLYESINQIVRHRIAISKATAKFVNIHAPFHYEVIYNGIDTTKLTPDGPKINSWNDGKDTIIYIGRHDARKGIQYLLEAYGLLQKKGLPIKLKITGDGMLTQKLKKQVKKLKLKNVSFVGVLPREKLIMAIRSADILVAPSIGREGFGRILAEAMSAGVLVVGSDINGYREVMNNEPFTKMVKPKDPKAIADAIEELLKLSPETRKALGEKAREYAVKNFDWETIAEQTALYYKKSFLEHQAS